MNRLNQAGSTIIIVVIAGAVLLGGAAAAYYFTDGFGANKDKQADSSEPAVASDSTNQSDNKDNQAASKTATGKDTLPLVKAAVAGNGSIKCVSKTVVDEKNAVATMYIKDANNSFIEIRTDMGTMYTLFKDQTHSYTWAKDQSRGTKFAITKDDRSVDEQWEENLREAEASSELQGISCAREDVDNALFVLPVGVTFSDASQFTNY